MKKQSSVALNLCKAIILCGVFWHSSLFAGPPLSGSTLELKNDAVLRHSPPSKHFLFIVKKPGHKVKDIKKGQTFTVHDTKEIAVPFGKDIWVKGSTPDGDEGWVYYGEKEKAINFIEK